MPRKAKKKVTGSRSRGKKISKQQVEQIESLRQKSEIDMRKLDLEEKEDIKEGLARFSGVPLIVKIISVLYVIAGVWSVIMGIAAFMGNNLIKASGITLGSSMNLATLGIISLIVGVVALVSGIFLWKLKKWAKTLVIVLSAIGIILALVELVGGNMLAIVELVADAAIGGYLLLSTEAKSVFS